MLRLVYSNRTDELLAELAARVRAQQNREGPLKAVPIVVPSTSLEGYVRNGIASACGIAANLDVTRLTRFAADVIAATGGPPAADAAAIEAMVLTLLLDDARVDSPELAPVRAYLRACGQAVDPIDMRRVQLAGRLGRLFEEYTYSRGDVLAAWASGSVLGTKESETEGWQRSIWLSIFGPGGLAEVCARRGSPRIVPMHEAVAALDPGALALPRGVHVFGFSHVARTFHDLFERLARRIDVVIYALSPCEGFWEDADPHDPLPLRMWGRPGRDQVRVLNAMAGFDHEDRFVEPPGAATILRRLQSDILRREPIRSPGMAGRQVEFDGSIVLLEHASVRREIEAVASEIWRLVESEPTLHFDDIAVLVPESDAKTYATHLPTVFRETHDLPHQMPGLPAAGTRSIDEAIALLLAVPLGRFTRQDVLRVALHPAVIGLSEATEPARWLSFCEALGIVHGADRADHVGTYIARDALNWDQGLRRLALGAFMSGDASGEEAPFELGCERYVPHEVSPSELHDASALGRLVRSLLADAQFARQSELTLPEWSLFLRALVDTYLAPPADPEELARVFRALHAVGGVDVGGQRVRYRVAYELARDRLLRLNAHPRGDGVVVSTLLALGPIPFRVVFACGMGEGRFPSPEPDDPLDLRGAKRRPGDVSARERDRYAFLELLLETSDKLYLSYVSREAITGDCLAPSSVVEELVHALAAYGVDANSCRRSHPMRRWDPTYFPDVFPARAGEHRSVGTMALPEARAEALTLALRRDLEARGATVGQDEVRARAADDPSWAALAEHLALAQLPTRVQPTETRISIPIYAIVKFLEFPLQGWARFRLGLDEVDEDDAMACEDEPFETDYREETMFLRAVLLEARNPEQTLEQAYDAAALRRELRGSGPSGVFARGERRVHLDTLNTWRDELAAHDVAIETIEVHRFGRAGEHARADRVHDGMILDVDVVDAWGVQRVVRAEVGGRTLPLGGDAAQVSLTLGKRAEQDDEWARAGRERAALRAFVDHAVLSATGVASGRRHASLSILAGPEGPVNEFVGFGPLTRDEAVVWLRDVARDILGGSHAYFLPCEAVFVHNGRGAAEPVTPVVEAARDLLRDSNGPPALRSAYGPVPRLHEYDAPDEGEARSMIARRFGLYFRKREVRP